MKKGFVRMFFVAICCIAIGNVHAQGLKGLLNKAKKTVTGSSKTETGKDDKKAEHAIAKPLAPDVKNSVSEIRSLTGLTKEDFEKKAKSLGYAATTDETGLYGGGTVYKSSSKGIISVKMGTRGKNLLTREITKYTYNKKADLTAMKGTLLSIEKQCTDLKAELKDASIDEKGKVFGGINAKNNEARTSKFLPALDKMISEKKEFFVRDEYAEPDYTYRTVFYYIKMDASAILQLTVVDNTVESQEG